MGELNKIVEKINKINEFKLSKVNVNLGLTQDAEKAIKDYYSKYDNAVSKIKGAISELRSAGVAFEKVDGVASILDDYDKKLEAAAKELGVSTKDWAASNAIKQALKHSDLVSDYIKTINTAISSL